MPRQASAVRPVVTVVTEAPQGDTKARLLDAVVQIFAEQGFHATSMRAVTQLAGTSVSAANYHFGSKEELLRTALIQRAAPLNDLRLKALASAEAQTSPARRGSRPFWKRLSFLCLNCTPTRSTRRIPDEPWRRAYMLILPSW